LKGEVVEMLESFKAANPEFKYTMEDLMIVHPVHTDENCDLVQMLGGCIEQVAGTKAGFAASPGHMIRSTLYASRTWRSVWRTGRGC